MKKPTYFVRVNLFESNVNGMRNSENFEYTFEDSTLIESRDKAIEMVKDLTTYFISGTSEENEFSSLHDVKQGENDFFHAFQIDLIFSPEDDCEFQIYGEESMMIHSLMKEGLYYKENLESQPLIKISYEDGDEIEVLESNNDFFLN